MKKTSKCTLDTIITVDRAVIAGLLMPHSPLSLEDLDAAIMVAFTPDPHPCRGCFEECKNCPVRFSALYERQEVRRTKGLHAAPEWWKQAQCNSQGITTY